MNQLYQQLNKRKEYLLKLQEKITLQSKDLPEGRLRVNNDRGIARYYHINKDGDTRGEYISKKEIDMAYKLAQKDYLQKLYCTINNELKDIDKYLLRNKECAIEDVFTNLNSYRQNLVTPLVISDDLYVQQWEKELYQTNPYYPDFTLLQISTRELIYHEHFGLLDDGEYRHACFAKLDEYRNNGIYLGKNLIITYEAEGSYLNIKEIRQQMQSILAR